MLRVLLIGFALLLVSALLGMEIATAKNSVIITYNHWVIESSLWVALLGILLLFIVWSFILRLFRRAMQIKPRYNTWRTIWRLQRSQAYFEKGLRQLAGGDWALAEKTLIKTAKITSKPLLAYLAAAQSAQAQQAIIRRDNYLQQAHAVDKKASRIISLVKAQLQMQNHEWDKALATLEYLHNRFPRHAYIIKLFFIVQQELKAWTACYRLLPVIRKYKIFDTSLYNKHAYTVYLECLHIACNQELSILNGYWKALPRVYRKDETFVLAYVKALLHYQQDKAATQVIHTFLKKQKSPTLDTLRRDINI